MNSAPSIGADPPKLSRLNLDQTSHTWQRCNDFQQMMFHWRRCGPYNAVHAMFVEGPPDVGRLHQAIEDTYRSAGIGLIELDYDRMRYRYVEGVLEPPQSRTLDDLDDDTIAAVITEQINRPFLDGPHVPVRWLVLTTPSAERHAVLLSYDHVVADATAIQALIAEVFARGIREISDAGQRRVIVRDTDDAPSGWIARLRSLATLTRQYFALRYAHRVRERTPQSGDCGVSMGRKSVLIPEGFGGRAKACGVGLNACVMGAVVKTVAQMTPKRVTSRRRTGLGVSTIVSVRGSQDDETVCFDARLDSHAVFLATLDVEAIEIVQRIGQRMGTNDRRGVRSGCISAGQAFAIRRLWPLLGIKNQAASYRKLFPLCAGVSPFRVNESWYDSRGPRLQRVVRACPTGPALPVVVAATIHRSSVELVLTYRRACFDEVQASTLLDGTIEHLDSVVRSIMA